MLEAAQARGVPCCCAFELHDTVRSTHVQETRALESDGVSTFPADPIVVNGRRGWTAEADLVATRTEPKAGPAAGGPLQGIRIVDLGQIVAAPFAGQLLAALGAEVILVESASHLTSRLFGPFAGEPKHDAGMMFHQVNRGKCSVEIDLTNPTGQAVLRELVAGADVVLENFSRRAASRLGITYETLSAAQPDLILGSITGFGSTGPWRDYVALHSGAILMSGLASVTRDGDGQPRLAGAIYPDLLAGSYLALAVSQALLRRSRGGGGCHVEVSMLDVLLTCMGGLIPDAIAGKTFDEHPCRFLPTAETGRYLAVPATGVDPETVAGLTRREAMNRLQAEHVPVAAVLDIIEVMADPQLVTRGFVSRLEHPVAGARLMPGVPWLYDGVRPNLGPAPTLGNRTLETLTELTHLTDEEVESLRRDGSLA